MCGTICKNYAGTFIFNLHRKCLFLDFAAKKRNIFSRPDIELSHSTQGA